MTKRLIVAGAVTAVSAWLSYTAIDHLFISTRAAAEPSATASENTEDTLAWAKRATAQVSGIAGARRSNDIIVPDSTKDVQVCPTVKTEDVSDTLLARTKFGSRAALASFLEANESGFNALRRAILPEFVKAVSTVKSCYRPAEDDHAVVYLGLHIRANSSSASAVDATILRIDAPVQSQVRIQDCLTTFKAERLPISVPSPKGEAFADYDDLYLKAIPLPLGPRSIERMLELRRREITGSRQLTSTPWSTP